MIRFSVILAVHCSPPVIGSVCNVFLLSWFKKVGNLEFVFRIAARSMCYYRGYCMGQLEMVFVNSIFLRVHVLGSVLKCFE